jgi:hypothetical protein
MLMGVALTWQGHRLEMLAGTLGIIAGATAHFDLADWLVRINLV